MNFPFYRNIFLGTVIGLILLGVGSRFLITAEADDELPPSPTPVIDVFSQKDLNNNVSTLVAYGKVEAVQDSLLAFQINGEVAKIYVKPGDYVKMGQTIAVLKNEALAAQVSQATAGYEAMLNTYKGIEAGAHDYSIASARSGLIMAEEQLGALEDSRDALMDADLDTAEIDLQIKMQKEIVNQAYYGYSMVKDGASETTLAAQWAMVEQAKAGLSAMNATYDAVVLRAPFDGEVSSLTLQLGDQIAPGMPVGVIVNRDNIEAVTYLSADDARSISVHNEVLIDGQFVGEVIGISSRLDEMTKKRKVRVRMDSLGELIVGETVRMEFEQDTAALVTLVPMSALIFDDGHNFVLSYNAGVVEQVSVETGELRGDYIEVIKMPSVSIAEDVSGLRDGMEVNVK